MAYSSQKLIKLLNEKYTCNQICDELNITREQLYKRLAYLRNNGYMYFYQRKYYSNGEISYDKKSYYDSLFDVDINRYCPILTEENENNVKCLLISDLHFGSSLERIDLVNRAYDYCIKRGIHIIFIAGDLIDGTFSKGSKKISDIKKQFDYFCTNYPYDKNILNFGVGGDHDISGLSKEELSLIEYLKVYRHDVILNEYRDSDYQIKNETIHLYHPISSKRCGINKSEYRIKLIGHTHKYLTDLNNDSLTIFIPSLSNILNSYPTFIEMNLEFSNGFATKVNLKQIIPDTNFSVLGECHYSLLPKNDEVIRYTYTKK